MSQNEVERLRDRFPDQWSAYASVCNAASRSDRSIAPDSALATAIRIAGAASRAETLIQNIPSSADLEFQVHLWTALVSSLTRTAVQQIKNAHGSQVSQRFIESLSTIPSFAARRIAMEIVSTCAGCCTGSDEVLEYNAIVHALKEAPDQSMPAFNAAVYTRKYSTSEIVFATQTTRLGIGFDTLEPTPQALMQAWFNWHR